MSKCRGCGAEIIWVKTETGKPAPLDAKPEKRFVFVGNIAKLIDTYLTHFATCPQANEFRKRGGDSDG